VFKLSTRGRYGTRVMVMLALHYGKGPMLLKDIAQKEEISEGYLEQIVPFLKAADLIHASRGAHGGYALKRPPAEITLREIVQTLEGSLTPVECVDTPSVCNRVDRCVTRDVWKDLKDIIVNTLEDITLKDMVKRHKKKGG